MKDGPTFTCDACGVQARGIPPHGEAWAAWAAASMWPPARWLWAFGSEFVSTGPHACSRVCWQRYQDALWEAGCKIYIDTCHRAWDSSYPPPNECREVCGDSGRMLRLAPEHMTARVVDPTSPSPLARSFGARAPGDSGRDLASRLAASEQRWRAQKRERVIFFAQQGHDGPVKIGFSKRVAERMLELGSAAGKTLRLLGTMPGDKKDKLRVIEQFKDWQLGGEWFAPADDVLEFIRANGEQHDKCGDGEQRHEHDKCGA